MFKAVWRGAAALLLALVLVPVPAWALAVQLPDSVTVNGPTLCLGDVAYIYGDDAAQVAAWQKLPLGAAPAPGASQVLTNDTIRQRLLAAGQDLSGVDWQGAPQVNITAASQTIDTDALTAAARQALLAQLTLPPQDVTVAVRRAPPPVVAPPGTVELAAVVPSSLRFGAPVAVEVNVRVNDALVRSVPVLFDVTGYIAVVTAQRPLAARTILGANDVALVRQRVEELPPGYFTSLSQVLGQSLRRPVGMGTVLSRGSVVPPVVVHRGGSVVIEARVNGIEVHAAGVALNDGAQGQVIRVQNVASRRILPARVVDATTVRVIAF